MLRDPRSGKGQTFLAVSQPEPATQVLPSLQPHLALRGRFRSDAASKTRVPLSPRLIALGTLGIVLGVGSALLGVSFVQASDRVDMFEVARYDQAQRRTRMENVPRQVYTSNANSYAPTRPIKYHPLSEVSPQGRVSFPDFNFNPFSFPQGKAAARTKKKTHDVATDNGDVPIYDTVSGASLSPRSICVRLCDGYQHPLGNIRDMLDLPGHEALCKATFPGVPTRVFRVAPGAENIDNAVSSDGKTYRSLPMANAYQTAIDPACARPRTGTQTVSLLKDFTLRAGDTVIVNGRPRVFGGSSSYPYTASNFRDFRSSSAVSDATRKKIDDVVGVSRQERLNREVKRMSRVREANAADMTRAIDVVQGGRFDGLSARVIADRASPVRIIELGRR